MAIGEQGDWRATPRTKHSPVVLIFIQRHVRLRVSLSLFAIVLLAAEMFSPALGQPTPNSEIAPTGKLRAAVIGIRVLGGVGEPIGKFIAGNLGLPFESVVYPNPDAYEQSFGKGQWDIAIGPRVLAPERRSATRFRMR
jgi:hypothetical protein